MDFFLWVLLHQHTVYFLALKYPYSFVFVSNWTEHWNSANSCFPKEDFTKTLKFFSRIFTSFFNCGSWNCTQYLCWGCTNAEHGKKINSFDSLVILCLVFPLGKQSWPNQHFQTLFCRLLSSYSSPLNLFSELLQTGCRVWHIILLNLIPLFIGHYHNLSRTLCKMLLSRRIKSSFHLVSSTKLPVLHSTSASRLLVNILNRAGLELSPEEYHWWSVSRQM